MTPERFAHGMTFDDYVAFSGSPANPGPQGFDIRTFGLCRPRVDWRAFLRDRFAKARLTDEQAAAIRWLAARPGGPAKVLVLSEDYRVIGHLRAARPGETDGRATARAGGEIAALLDLPFPDVWAQAAVGEILSALHERLLTGTGH